MRVLELFSGTASVSNSFKERGHDVLTLDYDKRFNPTFCMDILDFDISLLEGKSIDVVWASPDCRCFSIASCSHHWELVNGEYLPRHAAAVASADYVKKTLEIIHALKPKFFFIENPRGLLRKMSFMQLDAIENAVGRSVVRHTITYCQYGDTRMKPTDIWTDCMSWVPRPMCHPKSPCHDRAPRGSKLGTQGLADHTERSRIPLGLCESIVDACECGL